MANSIHHNLSRNERFMILLVVYAFVLVTSTLLAYGLRFDFAVPTEHQLSILKVWMWVWPIKLIALALAGQFSSLLSFFSIPDLKRLGFGLGVVTMGLLFVWSFMPWDYEVSRGAIILDGIVAFLGISMIRLAFRLIRQNTSLAGDREPIRIGIVGAGAAGAALAREMQVQGGMRPIVFFDDAKEKHGTQVHGIPVVGPVEILQNQEQSLVEEVVIAMPSVSGSRVREVTNVLQGLNITFRTVPTMSQLAQGQVVTALRPVRISDVLGRESVDLETKNLMGFFDGKTVLVTGAGGSIGSELCRQLSDLNLKRLIMVERSEACLFKLHSAIDGKTGLVPQLLDVLNESAMESLLKKYKPEILFHAAAFKHVSLLEDQPAVAVLNNVLATHQLASISGKNGVEAFVLVSTDKAVDPASVMGATKRIAEQLIEGHSLKGDGTNYMSVRFGNVLASSGSVVPIFQKQIEQGGPVTVRGNKTTRFFMSIPEAAGLVLSSAALGVNGDQFILDMGKPVRIVDLAEQMIRLSGKLPREEIEIRLTELLPGEKAHESLHSADEQLVDTSHPKIRRVEGCCIQTNEWEKLNSELKLIRGANDDTALTFLRKFVPHFRPL
tara:strand:- start:7835 stop:9664 length:1830 start_codon:yes stop_codon:yes gene_type:complete